MKIGETILKLREEKKMSQEEFAQYLGSKYCVGLASGLDALWIAFGRNYG